MLRIPNITPVSMITQETHRTTHGVALMSSMIYYSERSANKISKEQKHMRHSLKKIRHNLKRVLSQWHHKRHFQFPQPQVMRSHVKFCLLGKLTRDSMLKNFIDSESHRNPVFSMQQNSRLPEGKQVFSETIMLAQTV